MFWQISKADTNFHGNVQFQPELFFEKQTNSAAKSWAQPKKKAVEASESQ